MTRAQIHVALARCEEQGIVRSYYAGSGDRGTRWVLEIKGSYDRVFTTREVEAFLLGVQAAQ